MIEKNYPTVYNRVNATVIDSVIIMIFIYAINYILTNLNVPDNARPIAFIIILILYEPILTSVFGGAIGHIIIGIRVKREKNQQNNIIFPLAIIRFIMKVLFGSISLLTVSGNNNGKAIHDLIVGSIVVYKQ